MPRNRNVAGDGKAVRCSSQPPAGGGGTTGGRLGQCRNPLLHLQSSPQGSTPVGDGEGTLGHRDLPALSPGRGLPGGRVPHAHGPCPRNLCLLWRMALNLLWQGTTVKTVWPSGAARPAAISPTWSKSWVSHNLAIALALGGGQWCRSCSIIDALPGCSAPSRRNAATRLVQVPYEIGTGWLRTSPMGGPD